jgi:four helix bundle protein
MVTLTRFEKLEMWGLTRKICKDIYIFTPYRQFRRNFSLVDQIRRSNGSIMDNIAEGYERDGQKEFIRFLSISKGSAGEAQSWLYRAYDYKFTTGEQLNEINNELVKLSTKIQNFINYLKKSNYKGHKYKLPHLLKQPERRRL